MVILAVFFSVWSLNIILVILAILFGRLIILEFSFSLFSSHFSHFTGLVLFSRFVSLVSFCSGHLGYVICSFLLTVIALVIFLTILGLLRVSFGHFSWFRHFGLFSRLVLGNFLVIW